jgi:hypothetical protein
MSQIDVMNAKRALAARLRAWGIGDDAASLAAGFIDDLAAQGWAIEAHRETRRQPPRRDQECRAHPGEWADACRPCATERRAIDADEETPTERADLADVRAAFVAAKRQTVASVKGWQEGSES